MRGTVCIFVCECCFVSFMRVLVRSFVRVLVCVYVYSMCCVYVGLCVCVFIDKLFYMCGMCSCVSMRV